MVSSPRITVSLLFALLLAAPARAADWLYLTVPGDTLIGIGQQYLKNPNDWPKVQIANTVAEPRKLPANTRIKIPVGLLKLTPAPVTVTAVGGNVRYKTAEGPFAALVAGTQLEGGETVLSGPGGSARYRFADGTRLTQQAASKLTFGRLAAYGKTGMVSTELSLASGRLEASAARQQAPAGGFKVVTPVAVAGLRGTGFRLNLAEDGKTLRNEVLEGAVAVSAQGRVVRVEGGYGTVAELGKPPEPPRPLLARPDLSGLPNQVMRLPLAFAWQTDPAAASWRAQIAADAEFATVLLEDVFPQAQWDPATPLPDGDYHLRLRGIDRGGLEGLHGDHAFSLQARPLPPVPVAPRLGERLLRHDADFSWAAAAGAQGYLLQIAPTPEFAQGLLERRLPGVTQHRETLPAGDWHWRAASLDTAGLPRAFSPHRAFRVQPPAPPVLTAPADLARSLDAAVRLGWQRAEGALAYRVQVAASADFNPPALEQRTADTTLAVRAPAPGRWFWRVAALGEADSSLGHSVTASWRYAPQPSPPRDLAIEPEGGLLLATWRGDAASYRLEIGRDAQFNDILSRHVVDQSVDQQAARLARPAPGNYWLRVVALDGESVESPPSAALAFTIQPPMPWWLLPFMILPP